MPTVLGTLAPGTQPLSILDQDFDSVARMGILACTPTGTNTIALTGLANYPTLQGYGNNQKIGFVALSNSTNSVTINVNGLGAVNAYKNDGVTQLGSGDIVAGAYYELAYLSTLNTSAGGFQLTNTTGGTIKSVKYQTFTTAGSITYVPSAGLIATDILAVAGGGGGGGASGNTSGAGGAGAGVWLTLTAAQVGTSLTGIIGIGGPGGTAGNDGTAGGLTTLTGILLCPPGGAGLAVGTQGAGGSVATVAVGTNVFAQAGQAPTNVVSGGSMSAGGGNAPFGLGFGGAGGITSGPRVGGNATGAGAGGGGANADISHPSVGGNGTPGCLIFRDYCSQ